MYTFISYNSLNFISKPSLLHEILLLPTRVRPHVQTKLLMAWSSTGSSPQVWQVTASEWQFSSVTLYRESSVWAEETGPHRVLPLRLPWYVMKYHGCKGDRNRYQGKGSNKVLWDAKERTPLKGQERYVREMVSKLPWKKVPGLPREQPAQQTKMRHSTDTTRGRLCERWMEYRADKVENLVFEFWGLSWRMWSSFCGKGDAS